MQLANNQGKCAGLTDHDFLWRGEAERERKGKPRERTSAHYAEVAVDPAIHALPMTPLFTSVLSARLFLASSSSSKTCHPQIDLSCDLQER
jgi:hypothetical protein